MYFNFVCVFICVCVYLVCVFVCTAIVCSVRDVLSYWGWENKGLYPPPLHLLQQKSICIHNYVNMAYSHYIIKSII